MRLRWLPAAAEDLSAISDYLASNSPNLRRSTMVELYDGVRALRIMPYRGRPGIIVGTRELVFPRLPYIATYRISRDCIEVLYIRHAAQEPVLG